MQRTWLVASYLAFIPSMSQAIWAPSIPLWQRLRDRPSPFSLVLPPKRMCFYVFFLHLGSYKMILLLGSYSTRFVSSLIPRLRFSWFFPPRSLGSDQRTFLSPEPQFWIILTLPIFHSILYPRMRIVLFLSRCVFVLFWGPFVTNPPQNVFELSWPSHDTHKIANALVDWASHVRPLFVFWIPTILVLRTFCLRRGGCACAYRFPFRICLTFFCDTALPRLPSTEKVWFVSNS